MRRRTWGWIAALLIPGVIAISPMLSVATASLVASLNDCQLDEGSAHECIVMGVDAGEILYSMGVMGWFVFLTLPLAGLLYLLVGATYVWRRAKANRRA